MSKLQRSFLKYIKRKPSFKNIMLCSALLLLELALLQFSKKFLDESLSAYGTMASLGIVILVGILYSSKIKFKPRQRRLAVLKYSLRLVS